MYRYDYHHQSMADQLQINRSTFSNKLKLNNWSVMEVRSIKEFINKIHNKLSYGDEIKNISK